MGMFLLFVWWWMRLVFIILSVPLQPRSHLMMTNHMWNGLKVLCRSDHRNHRKAGLQHRLWYLLILMLHFVVIVTDLWLWTCPHGSSTLVLSLSFCLDCFHLCYFSCNTAAVSCEGNATKKTKLYIFFHHIVWRQYIFFWLYVTCCNL